MSTNVLLVKASPALKSYMALLDPNEQREMLSMFIAVEKDERSQAHILQLADAIGLSERELNIRRKAVQAKKNLIQVMCAR